MKSMNLDNIRFKGTFRSYQQRILDAADTYLVDGKINIVAAPGSGKTILGLELIRRLGNPCIILSPTTTIKEQWGERFKESFLPDNVDINEYVNYDLNKIVFINSITYQALYSAINKVEVATEDEIVDYSSIDLFKIMRQNNIKTICLDEAHHLQNEWQKALEKFISALDKDVKIISLTATPPYDAKTTEWQRYISVCGEIDEEIFVPELVKQGTLSPHQDYVIFNYPTSDETKIFKEYKENSYHALNEIKNLSWINVLYESINTNYKSMLTDIYTNVKDYIALLILFNYYEFELDSKLIKALTNVTYLPLLTLSYAETALQFLIDSDLIKKIQKEELIKILKENQVYEKNKVSLELDEKLKRNLISSLGKMDSILKIVESEYSSLGTDLRMLILTDYIKKESLNKVGTNDSINNVSVVSIFEKIRKSTSINMGILSGNLVVLPNSLLEKLKESYTFTTKTIDNTTYSTVNFKGTNKDKVRIVSKLFEDGFINILIGTKSLLGEGWDSPCINSLILASFIGSFMLSNQMRGRAIRIDKNHPDKVSNIWHLVTIEPDYMFEEKGPNKLLRYVNRDNNTIQSVDYQTLERRFDCFVGPSYDTNMIESGIERITTIKPPYDQKGIEKINQNTLALSKNRILVKERWQASLEKTSKVGISSEVPKTRKIPVFTFINMAYALLIIAIEGIIINALCMAITRVAIKSSLGILVITTIVITLIITGVGLIFVLRKLLANLNPTNQIKTFAKCILKTLKDVNLIESPCSLKVNGEKEGIYINVSLNNATLFEQNLFNTAITEFLNPIDNPRYVIIRKNLFNKYNYIYSFACPSIIGKNKETAEIFKRYLSKLMGKYDLVYTRSEEGRMVILKCRQKSYISYNAKRLVKKHKLNRWS